jgi:transcriptional regulator with XRE-family HTH domain
MPIQSEGAPDRFASFGSFLQFLRRRVRKSLRDLALAVGYSEAHISRIERGERQPPDRAMLLTWFVPALELEQAPELTARLLELAERARQTAPREAAFPRHAPSVPAAPSTPVLEPPEGTMPADSPFYVERPADAQAWIALARPGVTLTIKGPRQVGKSSLLMRIQHRAAQAGRLVAYLDFQQIDAADLADAERFFRHFCVWLSDVVALPSQVEEYWQMPLGNIQRCSRYIERYLLPTLGHPLILAMDEVDALVESPFRSDFFGMLRSWHNARSLNPIWRQLDLALVTSTEPQLLIATLHQSPFNVGEILELPNFTPAQVADLNVRHGTPLQAEEVAELWQLTSGHPFLVRRALYVIASGQLAPERLFAIASDDGGPFDGHLRHQLACVYARAELATALRHILRSGDCPDESVLARLLRAGLVRRRGASVALRCPLYASYFQQRLRA